MAPLIVDQMMLNLRPLIHETTPIWAKNTISRAQILDIALELMPRHAEFSPIDMTKAQLRALISLLEIGFFETHVNMDQIIFAKVSSLWHDSFSWSDCKDAAKALRIPGILPRKKMNTLSLITVHILAAYATSEVRELPHNDDKLASGKLAILQAASISGSTSGIVAARVKSSHGELIHTTPKLRNALEWVDMQTSSLPEANTIPESRSGQELDSPSSESQFESPIHSSNKDLGLESPLHSPNKGVAVLMAIENLKIDDVANKDMSARLGDKVDGLNLVEDKAEMGHERSKGNSDLAEYSNPKTRQDEEKRLRITVLLEAVEASRKDLIALQLAANAAHAAVLESMGIYDSCVQEAITEMSRD